MSVRTKVELAIIAAVLVGGVIVCLSLVRGGFSARDEPSAIEDFIAHRMRRLAVPRAARETKNPVAPSQDVLLEARAHFADHCATCHGNDGRGKTGIGQNLYPSAPDMQMSATQSLSDGELFYIIHNGIRLTGMPAWGADPPEEDLDSWKLVHFIRHLPSVTLAEIEEMRKMNPMSRKEFEEQQEIEEFLQGGEPGAPPPQHEH